MPKDMGFVNTSFAARVGGGVAVEVVSMVVIVWVFFFFFFFGLACLRYCFPKGKVGGRACLTVEISDIVACTQTRGLVARL